MFCRYIAQAFAIGEVGCTAAETRVTTVIHHLKNCAVSCRFIEEAFAIDELASEAARTRAPSNPEELYCLLQEHRGGVCDR